MIEGEPQQSKEPETSPDSDIDTPEKKRLEKLKIWEKVGEGIDGEMEEGKGNLQAYPELILQSQKNLVEMLGTVGYGPVFDVSADNAITRHEGHGKPSIKEKVESGRTTYLKEAREQSDKSTSTGFIGSLLKRAYLTGELDYNPYSPEVFDLMSKVSEKELKRFGVDTRDGKPSSNEQAKHDFLRERMGILYRAEEPIASGDSAGSHLRKRFDDSLGS